MAQPAVGPHDSPWRRRRPARHCLVAGSLILLGSLACRLTFAEVPPPSPATRNLTPAAEETLSRLAKIAADERLLLGQNAGHSNYDIADGWRATCKSLERATGQQPGLLAVDYGYNEIPANLSETNRRLLQHVAAGGMVSVSMHPPNPWTGGDVNDTRGGPYADLVRPGTPAHRRWRATLDRVAEGLRALRDQQVVVLWRPLHEMNGGWFWWCANRDGTWPTHAEFTAVWHDMFEYFTQDKQLDNLLWVYSAAVRTSRHEQSALHYYPGGDYVDLVGLDWYMATDDLAQLDRWQSYRQLASLRKPFGLTEFGPATQRDGSFDARTILEIHRQYPQLAFVVFWHSWPENRMALAEQRHVQDLVQDPTTITLGELPTGP